MVNLKRGIGEMILTYKVIAQKAGVSHNTIRKIMCGARRASPTTAYRLERVTGIPAEAWVLPEKFDLRKRYQELKDRIERS